MVVLVSKTGCSVEAVGRAVGESERGAFLWWKWEETAMVMIMKLTMM